MALQRETETGATEGASGEGDDAMPGRCSSAPSSPLPDAEGKEDGEDVGIGAAQGRRSSFSFFRLPEPLLRLSVLKLDGSSFEVQVPRHSCVGALKAAIEDVFTGSPKEDGCDVSWSHVWSYFCLCCNDHKLIDDKASLQTIGIKDGDQLHFIRHISVDQEAIKRRSRSHVAELKQHKLSLSSAKVLEVKEDGKDRDNDHICSNEFLDGDCYNYDQDRELTVHREFKLGQLFRGWLSYSRLRTSWMAKSERRPRKRFSIIWQKIVCKR